jgi:hypothetical protein
MIAYIQKNTVPNATYKFILRIVAQPCNGAEYQNAEIVPATSKKIAKEICKFRGVTPYNF